jgi:hypothetical protein
MGSGQWQALTLTDIPNPDGWDLHAQDMFLDNRLGERAGMTPD